MKTKVFIAVIIASLTLLVSATVWEGVTDVVSKGDLPGNYSVATNSFPKNSVVDITNLENGKTVRALVVSGLETTGLLATLSRNAALSLELRGGSTCRIRITQPSDDIAFSRFKLGPVAAVPPAASEKDVPAENKVSADTEPNNITAVESDSGADSAAAITHNKADDPLAAEAVAGTDAAAVTAETAKPILPDDNTGAAVAKAAPETTAEPATPPAVKPVEKIAGTDAGAKTAKTPVKSAAKAAVEPAKEDTAGTMASAAGTPEKAAVQTPVQVTTERYTNTGMEPVKPVAAAVVQPAAPAAVPAAVPAAAPLAADPSKSGSAGNLSIIPSEERPPVAPENRVSPPKTNTASPIPSNPPNSSSPKKSDFSPFQVPLISRLEQGKCYVQVAAYQKVEHVEDAISRIGTTYPLAVQNVGSDINPMFRLLLGPLNQGESGAMLQRFKSIGYDDAFIRYN